MDDSAGDVERKSQDPEQHQQDDERPEHLISSLAEPTGQLRFCQGRGQAAYHPPDQFRRRR
jgi:hypothetical protein